MGADSFMNSVGSGEESFRLPGGYRLEYRTDTHYFGSTHSGWVVMGPTGEVCSLGSTEAEALERFGRLGHDFPDPTDDYKHFGKLDAPVQDDSGVEVNIFLQVITP
jgi:hypothetical protein